MNTTRKNRPDLSFRRYTGSAVRTLEDVVESIYRASYVDAISSGHSFRSVEAFMSRFYSYSTVPGIDYALATVANEPVAQTWGWPLGPRSGWWQGLAHEPEPGFTVEDGTRTFALSEIMVVQKWTGHGVAHALHDFLLKARGERRATLLVELNNATARRIYEKWGWTKVSELIPGWPDAPTYDVMIKELAETTTKVAP